MRLLEQCFQHTTAHCQHRPWAQSAGEMLCRVLLHQTTQNNASHIVKHVEVTSCCIEGPDDIDVNEVPQKHNKNTTQEKLRMARQAGVILGFVCNSLLIPVQNNGCWHAACHEEFVPLHGLLQAGVHADSEVVVGIGVVVVDPGCKMEQNTNLSVHNPKQIATNLES